MAAKRDTEEVAQECYLAVKRVADAETKLPDGDWIDLDPVSQAAVDEWQEAKDDACAAIMQVVKTLGLIDDLIEPIQDERAKAERSLRASGIAPMTDGGRTVRRTVNPLGGTEDDR